MFHKSPHATSDQPVRGIDEDKIWLDKLPQDVLSRIFKFVQFDDSGTPYLLCTAETTAKQAESVLSYLDYELNLEETSKDELRRWAVLFKDAEDAVKHVKFNSSTSKHDSAFGTLAPVLTSASLETANICGIRFSLGVLHHAVAVKLRELKIRTTRNTKRGILGLLASTTAAHLTLDCSSEDQYECGLECVYKQLPGLCKRFKKINLTCHCRSTAEYLWILLRRIPTITSVHFHGAPPEDMYPILSKLEWVDMVLGWDGTVAAKRLAENVTGVSLWGCSTRRHFADLVPCNRLKLLSFAISADEDYSGEEVTTVLKTLKELTIYGDFPEDSDEWYSPEDSWLTVPGRLHEQRSNVSTRPGVVRDLVERTSELSSLCLEDLKIEQFELRAILRHCGPGLKRFTTEIAGQTETEWVRLGALVDSMACYNHNLERMSVREFSERIEKLPPAFTEDGRDPKVLKTEGERLKVQVMQLERCVPFLRLHELRSYVDNLITLGNGS